MLSGKAKEKVGRERAYTSYLHLTEISYMYCIHAILIRIIRSDSGAVLTFRKN